MGRISKFKDFQKSAILENSDAISIAAKEKIKDCKVKLVAAAPFFGKFSLELSFEEDRNLKYKTMATDGTRILYDPNFVMQHTDEEIRWVICHEIMHCSLFHFIRKQANPTAWNAACDWALNQLIDETEYKVPPGASEQEVKDLKRYISAIGKMPEFALNTRPVSSSNPNGKPEYKGWSAEQIYDHIIENNVQLPPEEGWNYGNVEPPDFAGRINRNKGGSTSSARGPMAKVGDYVALPGGGYGVVTAIDGGTGDAEINPMTEVDIKKEIESSTGKKVQSIK